MATPTTRALRLAPALAWVLLVCNARGQAGQDAPQPVTTGGSGELQAEEDEPVRPPDPAFEAYRTSLPALLREGHDARVEDYAERLLTQGDLGSRSRRKARAAQQDRDGLLASSAELSLAWLAAHQSPDGRWSGADFADQCGTWHRQRCGGAGLPFHDVGITGLVLLSLLRGGHGEPGSAYEPAVRRGLDWLIWVQGEDGRLGDPLVDVATYDHCIATLALSEAALLDDGERWKAAAARALPVLSALRNPGAAWRYTDRTSESMTLHPNDVSVTGWAIQALVAAREAGLRIDDQALADAYVFVAEMTDPLTGRTGYFETGGTPARPPGGAETWPWDKSESMTAAALLCRILVDPGLRLADNPAAFEKGTGLLLALPPTWVGENGSRLERVDYYGFYYGSRALGLAGGPAAVAWRDALIGMVMDHGLEDHDACGSWDPAFGPWGLVGGRVYSTAMMTMALLAMADVHGD